MPNTGAALHYSFSLLIGILEWPFRQTFGLMEIHLRERSNKVTPGSPQDAKVFIVNRVPLSVDLIPGSAIPTGYLIRHDSSGTMSFSFSCMLSCIFFSQFCKPLYGRKQEAALAGVPNG